MWRKKHNKKKQVEKLINKMEPTFAFFGDGALLKKKQYKINQIKQRH